MKIAAGFLAVFAATAWAKSPPVKVSLRASWNASPFQLELLETATSLQPALFDELLDFVAAKLPASLTHKQVYEAFMASDAVRDGMSEPSRVIMDLYLAAHSLAPAIEAYYHFYLNSVTVSTPCLNWALVDGKQFCSLSEALHALTSKPPALLSPEILSFDHIYQPRVVSKLTTSTSSEVPVVVLYADVLSADFPAFHSGLKSFADKHAVAYIIRWKPSASATAEKMYLTGYGVELALKSMEYKVTDDQSVAQEALDDAKAEVEDRDVLFGYNFPALKLQYPELSEKLDEFKATLASTFPEDSKIRSLKSYELQDIGVKAASFIMDSPVPLKTMKLLVQDFPKYADSIGKLKKSSKITAEVDYNQKSGALASGAQELYINGLSVDVDRVDIFGLFGAFRTESNAVNSLLKYGFSSKEIVDIFTSSIPPPAKEKSQFETYDLREEWEKPGKRRQPEQSAIIYWNDLERDSRYSRWGPSLMEFLKAQGQLPQIKRNIFYTIFAVDFSTVLGIRAVQASFELVLSNVPVRFGMLPVLAAEEKALSTSEIITRAFFYIFKQIGKKSAADFFTAIHEELSKDPKNVKNMIEIAQKAFTVIVDKELKKDDKPDFHEVAQTRGKFDFVDDYVDQCRAKTALFGLAPLDAESPGPGYLFVNGMMFDLDESFQTHISQIVQQYAVNIQKMVYYRQLTDNVDVYDFLLTYTQAKKRRNPFVVISEKNPLKVLDIAARTDIDRETLDSIEYISGFKDTPITAWMFCDFEATACQKSLAELLRFLNSDHKLVKKTRIAFIHTGNRTAALDETTFFDALETAFRSDEFMLFGKEVSAIQFSKTMVKNLNEVLRKLVAPGDYVMAINGRKIGPFPKAYALRVSDYETFLEHEYPKLASFETGVMRRLGSDTHNFSDDLLVITSSIYLAATKHVSAGNLVELGTSAENLERSQKYSSYKCLYSGFQIGNADAALIHIVAVLDPLSKASQELVSVLETLSNTKNVFHIKVCLNPLTGENKELPLKRFYRYAFSSKPRFDDSGSLTATTIRFEDVPVEPLLTLGVDVAQSWVVVPIQSVHDLDNIKLSDPGCERGINAELELQYILVEGHARDIRRHNTPRGLQFALGTDKRPEILDTIVMANLGYYQLKATPGVWKMRLRDGRSRELYDLVRVDDGFSEEQATDGVIDVVVRRFEGVILYTSVSKKIGMEEEDILEGGSKADGGVLSSLFNWSGLGSGGALKKKNAEINIFSVASGHLYERLLRVMILSVMKHTKHTVKFWFIENFLSPSFKLFIPEMAKKYNFEVELITYKWPRWLRGQSEKQRTIWGYKILFLDVLFPLDLDKVIFVDADQIVRVDLKELVDIDLKGAPYGYTPFCETRDETKGFRFWSQGYWKDHLRGKPYHISALYVIDLNRFRQIAAGDRLRQQYQQLSADPASLANLDQDLPNDMQHEVPIFSLPKEWLWCETWCDDQSLKKAKTIDLCNNPMTKEPKLDRAQRLLPEWNTFDQEARAVFDEWKLGHVPQAMPQEHVEL